MIDFTKKRDKSHSIRYRNVSIGADIVDFVPISATRGIYRDKSGKIKENGTGRITYSLQRIEKKSKNTGEMKQCSLMYQTILLKSGGKMIVKSGSILRVKLIRLKKLSLVITSIRHIMYLFS